MTNDSIEVLQNHTIHSRQYLENAFTALRDGEAGKAGELLWGSVAQAVQAVAASRNRRVQTHRELKNFAIQLSRGTGNETIATDFILAKSLHHNFYDIQQEPQDILIVMPAIQQLLETLFRLIPPELLEQHATA